jgi:uncharacterized membrane protein YphA (DoxX/SURF4 family)
VKNWFEASMKTQAPPSLALVRILVGTVFLSEGIQKFLFPVALGAGRFAKLGFPSPHGWPQASLFSRLLAGFS